MDNPYENMGGLDGRGGPGSSGDPSRTALEGKLNRYKGRVGI